MGATPASPVNSTPRILADLRLTGFERSAVGFGMYQDVTRGKRDGGRPCMEKERMETVGMGLDLTRGSRASTSGRPGLSLTWRCLA